MDRSSPRRRAVLTGAAALRPARRADRRNNLRSGIAAEAERALAAPGIREQMLRFSQYPDFRGPQAFAALIRDDSAFYKDLIEKAGIKVE